MRKLLSLGLILSVLTFGCKAQDVQVECLKNYYLAGVSVPTTLNGTKFTGIKLTTVGASSSTYLTFPVNTSVSGNYVALRGNNGYTANIKYTAALPAFASTGALVAFVQGCVPDALPTGGADNWGSQVVQHDATLTGTGIIGNTLRVDTSKVVTPYALSLNRPVVQALTRPTYIPDDNTDARIWHNITDGIMYEFKDGKWYSFGTIISNTSPFQEETIGGITVSNINVFWYVPNTQQTYINVGGASGSWQAITAGASGAAGGDLVGTYPNPFIGAGKVTSSKIASEAVTTSKIAEGAITNSKIADNAVTTATILDAHVTAPKIADGAVTISKIATGAVTTTKLGANSVTNAKIADNSVTAGKLSTAGATDGQAFIYSAFLGGFELKTPTGNSTPTGAAGGALQGTYPNPTLADNSVTDGSIPLALVQDYHLANGSVTSSKIENLGVHTQDIADLAVTGDKIADETITETKIANGSVTFDKLAENSVTAGKINAWAVTTSKIAPSSINSAHLTPMGATTTGQVLAFNGSTWAAADPTTAPTGAAGGSLTGTYPNPTLGTGVVGTSNYADLSITSAKISNGGIALNKISSVGATDGKVLTFNGTLAYPEWQTPISTPTGAAGGDLTGTYPNPTIGNSKVLNQHIVDGAITTSKMATGTVGENELGTNAVSVSKIQNGNVTLNKINSAGAVAGNVLTYNGTALTWAAPPTPTLPTPIVLNQQNGSTLGGGITLKKAVNNSNYDWTIEQFSGTNGTSNPPVLRLYPTSVGVAYGLCISEQGKLVLGNAITNVDVAASPSKIMLAATGGYVGLRNLEVTNTAGAVGMDIAGNVVISSETFITNFGSHAYNSFGNIKFIIPSTGNKSLQLATKSGSSVVIIGTTKCVNGSISVDADCSQTINGTYSYLNAAYNATANGDFQEVNIYDNTNQVAYKVSCIYNFTSNKAIITVHKLN